MVSPAIASPSASDSRAASSSAACSFSVFSSVFAAFSSAYIISCRPFAVSMMAMAVLFGSFLGAAELKREIFSIEIINI